MGDETVSVFQGGSPRGEMQMSAKEEIMFTHKYSSEHQPHLNAAVSSVVQEGPISYEFLYWYCFLS